MTTALDTWCFDELQPGRKATGLQPLAARCYHRLTTRRGLLRGGDDEANFGLDLADEIGQTDDRLVAASLPGRIAAELAKETQLDSSRTRVDVVRDVDAKGDITWDVTIRLRALEGPFRLVLAVSGVTVELLDFAEGT